MKTTIFDLYSNYLLSSFGPVTATGLSSLLEGDLSHDHPHPGRRKTDLQVLVAGKAKLV